jgi:hypothetical protein
MVVAQQPTVHIFALDIATYCTGINNVTTLFDITINLTKNIITRI